MLRTHLAKYGFVYCYSLLVIVLMKRSAARASSTVAHRLFFSLLSIYLSVGVCVNEFSVRIWKLAAFAIHTARFLMQTMDAICTHASRKCKTSNLNSNFKSKSKLTSVGRFQTACNHVSHFTLHRIKFNWTTLICRRSLAYSLSLPASLSRSLARSLSRSLSYSQISHFFPQKCTRHFPTVSNQMSISDFDKTVSF